MVLMCFVLIRARYCQLLHNIIDVMIQQSYCEYYTQIHNNQCITIVIGSQLKREIYEITVSVSHTVHSNYWKLYA